MAYNDLASNLLGGFKTGYGIGSDLRQRAKEEQFTSDITAAQTAAGDPNSPGYSGRLGAGLQTAYFKHGDPAGGFQAAEGARTQFKGRLEDNFKQINTLAQAGTPEAMAQANELLKSTYDMWPSGDALHAVHDPQSNLIHAQTVSEATGQPSGPPMTYDAPTLLKLSTAYLTDVAKMTDQDLVRRGQDQQKAIADREAELRDRGLTLEHQDRQTGFGLEGQRIGIAGEQLGLEKDRLAYERAHGMRADTLAQQQADLEAQKYAGGKDARDAGVMKDLAYVDYLEMGGKGGRTGGGGGGAGAWDQAKRLEADNAVRGIIKDHLTDDPMADTIAAATVETMYADPTGQVSPSMAFDFVTGMRKQPSRYQVTDDQGSPNTRIVTDLQTRRSYRLPVSTISAVTGHAAPVQAPPPAIGAGGRGPIHEQPMTGAGGRGPIDPRAVPAYGIR